MSEDKDWISVKEAAAIRNVSERTFLNKSFTNDLKQL